MRQATRIILPKGEADHRTTEQGKFRKKGGTVNRLLRTGGSSGKKKIAKRRGATDGVYSLSGGPADKKFRGKASVGSPRGRNSIEEKKERRKKRIQWDAT